MSIFHYYIIKDVYTEEEPTTYLQDYSDDGKNVIFTNHQLQALRFYDKNYAQNVLDKLRASAAVYEGIIEEI